MKNSILGKARWLLVAALATSKNNGARVAREWLKVAATILLLFIVGIGNVWATPTSGSLSFGSASGHVDITSSTTSLTDTNSKSWSFSQTQSGTAYFSTTTNDVQVGSNNSPLTSMSFSVTFASSIKVTAFSASFTGSSKKANQSVSLKVGTTEVASATISGASNVNPSYSNATGTTGTTLSVTLSGTAGGVKCISISYTYETISSKTLSSIAITTQPTTKKYLVGDVFSSTGAVVTATYSDKTTADVSASTSWTSTALVEGSNTITATYTEGGETKTATTTVTAYTVTVNKVDETGAAISDAGVSASCSGRTLSQDVGSTNYYFIEWVLATASGTSLSSNSITGTPSADVVVNARFYKPITITYKANNQNYTTQTYKYNTTLAFPASNPEPATYSCAGKTFVGWVGEANKNYSSATTAPTYATVGTVTEAATYYAVFAESGSGGGGSTTKTDELTYTSFFNACTPTGANTNGSYTEFSGKSGSESDAVYAGSLFQHGNGPANCKDYIQMKSKDNVSGIITTTSGGKAKKVTVEWNSATSNARVVNIYGKNTAYSAASDLYNDATDGDLLGTITNGTSTDYTITGDYEYIGIRSSDGSIYFDAISIDWQAGGGISYSNYTTNCVNMRTVYLDATEFGDVSGAKFAIYSWENADATNNLLAETFMEKVTSCHSDHLYVGEFPDDHDRVIFLRNAPAAVTPVKEGGNKWNQTSNISTDGDKDLFTIASGGAGDTYTGSWSVYTPYFAVTFDKNGAGETTTWPSDQCIANGGKASEPSSPQTMGKTFVGWYQEAEGTNAWVFNTNTVTAATTIYAKWNDVATKIIYLDTDFGDGDDNKWDKENVVIFAHAYIDGTSIYTDVKATSAISSCQPHVYAFTIPGNADYVTFARCATGATSIIWDGGSKNVYNKVSLPVQASKDYYLITGWGSNDVSTGRLETTTFTPVSYTISYNAGTSGSGSRDSESKACGVAFALPNAQVFTRDGYTMDGWATEDGGAKVYNLGGSYTTNAAQTFYPHWTEATYSVTLTTNGGTINTGDVTSYTYGTGATLPTDVTKAHATFQGWYASSTFEGERVYSIGTTEYGNKQYYAKWEAITYTVTWKANGGIVRTDTEVAEGDKVASVPSAPADLTTDPNGCDAEFAGWVLEANDPGALSISTQTSTPTGLFTDVAGSPTITGNVTFVAIYRQEQ